ncbi:MAG: SDR family oxidoreductase [Pedobacter sp.]|nr:MAG: SDR family oxidoreductase [Pedobacter sp.]
MINNQGKVAVVFGVRNDSSIAYAIAKALHASGCRIALTYLPESELFVKDFLDEIGEPHTLSAAVDVQDESQISSFLNTVHAQLGKIDYILHGVAYGSAAVLCNRFLGSSEDTSTYLDIPFSDLAESIDISAYSLLRITRAAVPYLASNASILTLTYNASQRVFPNYAGMGVSKAALENIMLYLADHFRGTGIRVNALSPGLVMTSSSGGIAGVRKMRKYGKLTAPLGNIEGRDVAYAALYYFSDLSTKVTGNIHYVDGGFNIMGVPGDGVENI